LRWRSIPLYPGPLCTFFLSSPYDAPSMNVSDLRLPPMAPLSTPDDGKENTKEAREVIGSKRTRNATGAIAVGMPVARHPPHRSVREGLLHTAPTSGNSRKAFDSGTGA
jgi:hypothetical protein